MKPTPYPHVNDVLDELLSRIRAVLGERLIGLYVFGSLVAGGFDDDVSDIDLLAAVTRDIDDEALEALRTLHDGVVRDYPRWQDRIEVAYVSLVALQTFKARRSRIAIISPGEPLHFKDAGRDWLMNWYLVRESDTTLYGPPPREVIAPVSKAEFIAAVRAHARAWAQWMGQPPGRGSRSYAILTMCRALYAHRVGEHTSKEQAASWAQGELPEWADLIRDALLWRGTPNAPEGARDATVADTMRFVRLLADLCSPAPSDGDSRDGQGISPR
ncbi:MAG: DUF4111 domain-containing protein [Chloroflexota bacterium]|nr:DUF4111 domain-containing protein [Chloroflexota bacterium]